jgi:hypothetical protein
MFWSTIGLAVAVAVWLEIKFIHDEFGMGLAAGFGVIILGGIAMAITIPNVIDANEDKIIVKDTEDNSYALRALANNTNLEGRQYFLGGGYIGEKQVFNYMTQSEHGAIRLQSMDAAQATIFEDTNTPHLRVIKTERFLPSVVPWDLGSTMHYDFHIPAGSVLETYNVDVNK